MNYAEQYGARDDGFNRCRRETLRAVYDSRMSSCCIALGNIVFGFMFCFISDWKLTLLLLPFVPVVCGCAFDSVTRLTLDPSACLIEYAGLIND